MTAQGRFCWADLITPSELESKAFYTKVLDWKWHAEDFGPEFGVYNMFGPSEDCQQGGLMQIREDMKGVPPHWLPYVTVDDVDASVEQAKALGGKVLVEAMDVPNVGRWASIADDQGGAIAIIALSDDDGGPGRQPDKGEFCWATLNTKSVAKASVFYASLFGWTIKETAMGDGTTQTFVYRGEEMIADIAESAHPSAPPHWLCAIHVEDLELAQKRAVEGGASVLVEPIEAGVFGRFNVIADPHGAAVSLFQPAQA